MKTKGTGGYVEFLWLQNVLFIISVMLVIFVFKADLKVAHTLCMRASRPEPILFLRASLSCTLSLPTRKLRLTRRLLASLPRRLPLLALNPRHARADSPFCHVATLILPQSYLHFLRRSARVWCGREHKEVRRGWRPKRSKLLLLLRDFRRSSRARATDKLTRCSLASRWRQGDPQIRHASCALGSVVVQVESPWTWSHRVTVST